jgi:hypothetical protein
MANSNSILSKYQELVETHSNQFDQEITILQEQVEARIKELNSLEEELVKAQEIELHANHHNDTYMR